MRPFYWQQLRCALLQCTDLAFLALKRHAIESQAALMYGRKQWVAT